MGESVIVTEKKENPNRENDLNQNLGEQNINPEEKKGYAENPIPQENPDLSPATLIDAIDTDVLMKKMEEQSLPPPDEVLEKLGYNLNIEIDDEDDTEIPIPAKSTILFGNVRKSSRLEIPVNNQDEEMQNNNQIGEMENNNQIGEMENNDQVEKKPDENKEGIVAMDDQI